MEVINELKNGSSSIQMVQDPDIALLAHRIGVKHWLEQDYYDCVYPDVMHSYGLSKKKTCGDKKVIPVKIG